jgi:hypothetical protein
MDNPGSKIFLADERGLNENEWFRSWNTFNFGKYQLEHKKSVGNLVVLNDDTLAPGRSLSLMVEEDFSIVIIPVIGAVEYKDTTGITQLIAAGQTICIQAKAGLQYEVTNPIAEIAVNFIQLWIKGGHENSNTGLYTYGDVNANLNQLIPVLNTNSTAYGIYIGKFSGRGEVTYNSPKSKSTLFVFVLAGAFEVEGCLLHDRDGLAMFEKSKAEMEALSNDAIILCIELPPI